MAASVVEGSDGSVAGVPLRAAPGEKFWATVVKRGSSDATWAAYEYVPEGAASMLLQVPSVQGDYEVRLHANYPRLTTHVVHRESLHVE